MPEKNRPACNLPYADYHNKFKMQFLVPGNGIHMEMDRNGVCYISTEGGESVTDIVAGDNIEINRTDDGKIVISSVNSATNISAGQNISIDIDPETGTAIINSVIGGPNNEHYKGVFDTSEDLIAADPEPETGDYGMVKNIVVSNGDTSWNGQYKYCFYINGQWTVVDQMLTFTKDLDLLQQYYSVGGSSPVIYLHEVARSGDFFDLNNIPIVATPVVTVEGTTVTATCATDGAEIWYTTDGTMPHVNGTRYTGPITVSEATNFRFVGIKNGMINSLEAVANVDYSLQSPTIELDWHDGTVTMGNPNASGTIYYTMDGSTPTTASTPYTGGINVSGNDQAKFRAIVIDGATESPVTASLYYRVGAGIVSRHWNHITGNYGICVAPSTEGAEVHITKDGSDPDWQSENGTNVWIYRPVFEPYTLKYMSVCEGYIPSSIMSMPVGESKPDAPTVSFDTDSNHVTLGKTGNMELTQLQTNNMSNASYGCRIYYTLDGSTPTASSTFYTGPFQITGNVTVKAVLVAHGQYYSDVTTDNIVIISEPSIRLNHMTGAVSMEAPAGASIYYTLDGSTPTVESTLYTGPIQDDINYESRTVKAIAVVGGNPSGVVSETFNRLRWKNRNTQLVLDTNIGVYHEYTSGTPDYADAYAAVIPQGESIYTSEYVPYTSAGVSVDYYDAQNPVTVYFKAVREGYLPGYKGSQPIGYTSPTAPDISYDDATGIVNISLAGNTDHIQLQTNNNVPSMGARIYYTTDGSTPTTSSVLYTAPFQLPENVDVIKAITVCYGEYASEVTTEEIAPAPSEPDYLCFTANKAGATLRMSGIYTADYTGDDFALEYSTDGVLWQDLTFTKYVEPGDGQVPCLSDTLTFTNIGDKVFFRGNNAGGTSLPGIMFGITGYVFFFSGGENTQPEDNEFSVTGDLQTIKDKTGQDKIAGCYASLFDDSNIGAPSLLITSAPDLTATTLTDFCYYAIYLGQVLLRNPSVMPLLTISMLPPVDFEQEHYGMAMAQMYALCTNLSSMISLEAIELDWSSSESELNTVIQNLVAMISDTTFNVTEDNGDTLTFDCGIIFPLQIDGQSYPKFAFCQEILGNGNGYIVAEIGLSADNGSVTMTSLQDYYLYEESGESRKVYYAHIPTNGGFDGEITAAAFAGYQFVKWQSSPDGQTWTDIPGATSTTYTATITQAGDYYYKAVFEQTNP